MQQFPEFSLNPAYLDFLRAITVSDRPDAEGREPDVDDARHVAAAARLQWRDGGPSMHATFDGELPTTCGYIPIRIYRPTPATDRPTIIYLHGGGWVLFDLDTHDRIMREHAARSGCTVVGVDYPRAPEAPYPAAVESIVACLEAMMDGEGARLGLCAPLFLAGDSAGANLALAATIHRRERGQPMPAGLILHYGVYDADFARPSYEQFSRDPLTLNRAKMAWFWDQYCPDLERRREALASPLRADLSALPAVHMSVAGCDILYDENIALIARLEEAAVPVDVEHYPTAPHGFLEAIALHPEPAAAVGRATAWLKGQIAA